MNMNKEVIKALCKRFLSSVITLLLLISLLFILVRLSPGDPAQKYISAELSPELREKITESFNLNEPVLNQYSSFLINAIKGDLGVSYDYKLPVLTVVWEYLSFTIIFALVSILIQLTVSLYLSVFIVKRNSRFLDNSISNISLIIYSTPAFVLGVFLIYVFSVQLNLFPLSGLKSLDYDSFSAVAKLIDQIHHIILPVITLSAAGVALFYKYLKENLGNVYNQTFVQQMRANGFSESYILKRHVIPNAIRPLISIAGIELGILMGGALLTEVIFGLPGMGRLTIDSILSRDYPLVIGCALAAGALMVFANFLADLVKMLIDKRMTKGILG